MKNELKLYAVQNNIGEWLATSDHCGSFHWHAFFPFASTYHDRGQANTAIARFGGKCVAFVPEAEVQMHRRAVATAFIEAAQWQSTIISKEYAEELAEQAIALARDEESK